MMRSRISKQILKASLILMWMLSVTAQCQVSSSFHRSSLEFFLQNNQSREISYLLEKGNIFIFNVDSKNTLNVSLLNPSKEVIYESISKTKIGCKHEVEIRNSGLHTLVFEDVSILKKNFVEINAEVSKISLDTIHQAKKCEVEVCSHDSIITKGDFIPSSKNQKVYTTTLKKGDFVKLKLEVIEGLRPAFQLSNDLSEVYLEQIMGRDNVDYQFEALNDQEINLTLFPPKFGQKIQRLKPNILSVQISRARHSPNETQKETPTVTFDTLSYMECDTLLFLGAQRDLVNESEICLPISFKDKDEILNWVIMFDVAKMNTDSLMLDSAQVLMADFAKNRQNKVRRGVNKYLEVSTSSNLSGIISEKTPIGLVEYVNDKSFITFENQHPSVGQYVRVYILSFRHQSQ